MTNKYFKHFIVEKFNELKNNFSKQRKYDSNAFYNSRVFIAFILSFLIPFCYSYNSVFYILFNLSIICICKELIYIKYLFYILPIIYSQFILEKKLLLRIVIYTQISDIFQYIGGKIGNYIIRKILDFLRSELSNFKIEFKNETDKSLKNKTGKESMESIGIKNLQELFDFCEKYIIQGHIIDISPNKTISGYVTGIISCFIIFSYLNPILSYKKNLFWYILGCLGDIYASYIKRERGIKDFSKLLGEHGGILDRFDSTIAVVHFYTWIKIFF
jgi:CDP-diglyceride synthetase